LRIFSFGGYGLALAALALVVFGAIECPPIKRNVISPQNQIPQHKVKQSKKTKQNKKLR